MKILAIGASSSSTSINRKLARFVARQVPGAEVTDLDIRDFDLPIYSADLEASDGIPTSASRFIQIIQSHDALVVSLAEHNGSYTAAFKNLYDWASRVEQKVWSGKAMLLLSTSPGARGGATVMEAAKATFPRMGADLRGTFSLPSFFENFSEDAGITDEKLKAELFEAIRNLAA